MGIEDFLIKFSPVLVNIFVSLTSALVALEISKYTINTNRKLNEENTKVNAENAGKNRTIYEIEQQMLPGGMNSIKEKLASGNYTVLNSFSNPSSWSSIIVILGKIKP
jgi:hypothetical protein